MIGTDNQRPIKSKYRYQITGAKRPQPNKNVLKRLVYLSVKKAEEKMANATVS